MDYYEKYWKKEIGQEQEGVAQTPPEWQKSDLLRIIKIIEPYCRGNILDLGCGNGTFSYHLSCLEGVKAVTGIDISNIAIAEARKKYPMLIFHEGDIETLSFANESFDFIAVSEVAEHVLDIQTMFKNACRVLKPNGFIFVTTTDFNMLKKIIIAILFWDKYFYPTNPHIRFFTKETLRAVLIKSGFKITKHLWNGTYAGIMPKGQIMIAQKI